MAREWNWKEQREKKAFLAFEDGSILRGHSVGGGSSALGEVVFNTGMTGYQEILTDPSYKGQIVTMTYPEIGNTGINDEDVEARDIFLNGFVMHQLNKPSNYRSTESLTDYLKSHNIPAIAGVDTRALTSKLRDVGTLKAVLCVDGSVSEEDAIKQAKEWGGLDNQDYASLVTVDKPYDWDPDLSMTTPWALCDELPPADLKVVAYDFGIKWNIARRLREQGMDLHIVPAKTPAEEILAMKPDGVFVSNGPADPAAVTYAVDNIRKLIGKTPLMGICLGHQLTGLALGGKTIRLKFGHHGCNHPVMNLATRAVEITSQNHNFSVDADTLDASKVEVTHINLNDQTVEGLRHKTEPLFTIQYHPEAAPGPHDASPLFAAFRKLILES
jgi:carbamoyl-phosphate synthase small subunit